ncbi:MAG: hypothetical protein R2737_15020 [Candidatus Nanopelagicales bacterium]
MTVRTRRWLAAIVTLVLAGAAAPLVATPAAAVPTYGLQGPTQMREGQAGTFVLTIDALEAQTSYCVSVDAAQGLTSAADPQTADPGDSQLVFSVIVTAATPPWDGATVAFSAYESAGPCSLTTPGGAVASTSLHVSGAPTALTMSPGTQTVPVDQATTITWAVTDESGQPTYLVAGEALYVISDRATLTFNGTSLTSLILGPGSPGSFTAQNSVAQSAAISGSVDSAAGPPDPSDQVTLVTTSVVSLAVTPTSATTAVGGTTTFSVTVTGAGSTLLPGVTVSAAVVGRNPRVSAPIGVTNQAGSLTWTLTDTNTTSPLTTDTVTFAASGSSQVAVVTYAAAASVTVSPTSITTPVAGTTAFTVTVKQPNGSALSKAAVYVTVAGRNPRASTLVGTTDKDGVITWSLRDLNTSSPLSQDTVTFTCVGGNASAVVTYVTVGSVTVTPATAATAIGGSTTLTATVRTTANQVVAGMPVTVASTGRNTYAAQSAGTTNAAGQVTWVQKDTAPASSTATTDTVTFSAGGKSGQAVITYSAPASVVVTSPSNGSAISSGGLFGVSAQATGVASGTTAYLTLNGLAKSRSTVQANGFIRFDNTTLGGGQWIPAEAGSYGVRICGGACGPTISTSSTFSLTIIPFQIVGQPAVAGNRLVFTVATGNWYPGTRIYLTRNGFATASVVVVRTGQQVSVAAGNRPGQYQVRVNSNQGYVYGNRSGVVVIR